jgi:tripartite-type tricarboxylate transporter receptor subunit TctC
MKFWCNWLKFAGALSERLLGLLALMFGFFAFFGVPLNNAQAQEWPSKQPIRLVVGYPPGGSADALARDLIPGLSKALGQTIIVDYKPGAGGAIGAEVVSKATPDGYTIGLLDNGPLTIQGNFRKLPFDPVTGFTPITGISKLPFVLLVHPQNPAQSLDDLIKQAKSKPGAMSYSSSGQGSMHHISGELFKNMTKTHILHIPYRGAAPALLDLLSGQVQMSFATIVPSMPYIQAMQLRPIAVTSNKRTPLLPNVPTLTELGLKDFDSQGWFAVFAPPNLPPPITEKLVAAFKVMFEDPVLLAKPSIRGTDSMLGTPEQLRTIVKSEGESIARLVKAQGIKAD